jgi:hypothetical protein
MASCSNRAPHLGTAPHRRLRLGSRSGSALFAKGRKGDQKNQGLYFDYEPVVPREEQAQKGSCCVLCILGEESAAETK